MLTQSQMQQNLLGQGRTGLSDSSAIALAFESLASVRAHALDRI